MSIRPLAAFAIAVLCAGCSSFPVESERNLSVDFATLHDYAWSTEVSSQPKPSEVVDAQLTSRVRSAVDTQLAARGKRQVEASAAQFLIRCVTEVEQKKIENDPYYSHYSIEVHEEGRLTIEFLDSATGAMLWRGTSAADLGTISAGDTFAGMQPVKQPADRPWPLDELVDAILHEAP